MAFFLSFITCNSLSEIESEGVTSSFTELGSITSFLFEISGYSISETVLIWIFSFWFLLAPLVEEGLLLICVSTILAVT